jgi:hypothetical protein
MPSGMSQCSSMMALRITQLRPMCTPGITTERSTELYSSMRTAENSSDSRTTAPEMMQPPDTSEFTAMPVRSPSESTNFAGGCCTW